MENVLQVLRLDYRHHSQGRDLNGQKIYIPKFKSVPVRLDFLLFFSNYSTIKI